MTRQAMFQRALWLGLALTGLGCWPGALGPTAPVPSGASALAGGSPVTGRVQFPPSLMHDPHIIPTGIGAVIATGPRGYRALAVDGAGSDGDLPVAGAWVVARDPHGLGRLVGVTPVRTDDQGSFTLVGANPGANVVVEAAFTSPDGHQGFRLLALARPGAAGTVSVSTLSTAVVAARLSGAAGWPAGVDAASVDPATLARLEQDSAASLATLAPEARQALLVGLVGIDPALVPVGDALPVDRSPAPWPSLPPLLATSPLPTAVGSPLAMPSLAAPSLVPGSVTSAITSPLASLLPSPSLSATPLASPSAVHLDVTSTPASALPSLLATPSPLPSLAIAPTPVPSLVATPTPLPSIALTPTPAPLPTLAPLPSPSLL